MLDSPLSCWVIPKYISSTLPNDPPWGQSVLYIYTYSCALGAQVPGKVIQVFIMLHMKGILTFFLSVVVWHREFLHVSPYILMMELLESVTARKDCLDTDGILYVHRNFYSLLNFPNRESV